MFKLLIILICLYYCFSCEVMNNYLYFFMRRNETTLTSVIVTKDKNPFYFRVNSNPPLEIFIENGRYTLDNSTIIIYPTNYQFIGVEKLVTIYYPIGSLNKSFNISINNITKQIQSLTDFDCKIRFPMRLSDMHPALYTIELCFYICIFILCLILRNKQPLKSRGILPFVSCICQLIMLLSNIYLLTNSYEFNKRYNCYFFHFMYMIFLNINTFLIPIQIFRYILIFVMNNKKNILSKRITDGEEQYFTSQSFYLTKSLNSVTYSLIFIFIIGFISCILSIIVLSSNNFRCNNLNESIYSTVCIFFICMIGILLFVILLVSKIRYKKWGIIDSFYYEIEICVLLPLIVLVTIIVNIIFATIDFDFYLMNILNTLNVWSFFVYQVIFILAITIFRIFKKKNRDNSSSLYDLIKDKEKYDMFYEFCEKEYSTENLLSYKDIQKYKTLIENDERLKFARYIHNLYLNGNLSNMEINVSKTLISEVISAIDRNQIGPSLFSSIEREILTNLSDTYSRFLFVPQYIEYTKSKDVIFDALENN